MTEIVKKIDSLQAIRGLAALLVVYFHLASSLRFGDFGVDIFFVLSGCVMCMLMDARPTPGAFLAQRLIRIVPLYAIMTTVALAVSWYVPDARRSGDIPTLSEYLMSLAFIPHRAPSGVISPVLKPGWTLNYEMTFYLFCAGALYFSRSVWVATTGVILMVIGARIAVPGSMAAEFFGNPVALEFLAGLAVWRIYTANRFRLTAMGMYTIVAIALVSMSAVGLAGWYAPPQLKLSYGRTVIMGGLGALIVGAALYGDAAFTAIRPSLRRLLVAIGDASYSIYLTHVFVVSAMAIMVSRFMPEWLFIMAGGIASLGIGMGVHWFVDRPIQLWLKRRAAELSASNKQMPR